MKKLFVSLVALCCLASLFGQEKASVKVRMTLEDAKKLALEQNPSIAQAKSNIAAAAAAVREAAAGYLPTVALSADVVRYRDDATRPSRDFDNHSSWNIGVGAQYTIFDGLRREMNFAAAKLSEDSSINQSDDVKRLLMQSVAYAFYSALLAQDSMRIALQDANLNRILLDDTEKRNQSGLVKPSEVENFKLKVGNAEVDYILAEAEWKVACIALGELLGIIQEDIWNGIELVPAADEELLRRDVNVEDLVAYALEHRPDYQQALTAIEIYQCQITADQSDYYPSIDLFANYGFASDHQMHINRNLDRQVNFGIRASWDIFNGGATAARVDMAKAYLEQAEYARENLELTIKSQIRQCIVNITASHSRLEKQIELVSIAQKIYDLVYEEYKGGRTTVTRVNDVLNDLNIAELAESQARIKLLNDYENLSAITGKNF